MFDGFPAVPLIGFGLLRAKACSERRSLATGAVYPKNLPILYLLSHPMYLMAGLFLFVFHLVESILFCVFFRPRHHFD